LIKKFLIVNKIDKATFFTYFRSEDEFRTFSEIYDRLWEVVLAEVDEVEFQALADQKSFKTFMIWATRDNIFNEEGEQYGNVLKLISKQDKQVSKMYKKRKKSIKRTGGISLDQNRTLN
jgi:hypothetical protein